jgi:hypothetical protein
MHRSKQYLFDHLVGEGEQPWRHLDAERSRRLHVDDKLEPGRPQHRQIALGTAPVWAATSTDVRFGSKANMTVFPSALIIRYKMRLCVMSPTLKPDGWG